MRYRDTLFPGVPVVFCGINDVLNYHFDSTDGYTGLSEDVDIASTIAIALKLHPGTKKIALIADKTETGLINLAQAREITRQFPGIAFIEMTDLSAARLSSKLKQLDNDTVVLNLGFFRDTEGMSFTARESMALILSSSPGPVYLLWDFALTPGAVGGMLIGGQLQGEHAARLTARILKGEKTNDLPVLNSAKTYMFDYSGLKKFGISEAQLPEGSIVTGRPDTFYARYKYYVWSGSALFVAQVIIIVSLLWNISRRRKEEIARKEAAKALRETNKMFSLLMHHSPVYVFIKEMTPKGSRVLMASDNFKEMTGFTGKEMVGKTMSDLFPTEFAEAVDTADRLVATRGDVVKFDESLNGRSYSSIRFPLLLGDKALLAGYYIDVTESKEYENHLKHIAHYDVLTSLPNRVLFGDRLHQAMIQAGRREQLLAVAYLDLDGFKGINDRHGHEVGDKFLVALAARMKQTLREGDTISRLGGDEFVALLFDLADIAASEPMITRLLVAAAQPVSIGGFELQVTASIGVTFYPQAEDVNADQLLRQADQAMYQAKLAGKNRYHLFDAEHDRNVRGRHEDLEDIRRALNKHEFVLHYQPKVNMRTGKVIGAEALIRWQHPKRGLVPPEAFLTVVEDHPLAIDIGKWVIDNTLTQMESWKAKGLDIPVSVNVGARQLQQADFVDCLRQILASHPTISPGALEMEVLETSALEDFERVSDVIESCREIGVLFSLDDFGTGYSSLTYLRRLSVNQLKIDQSFVRDMLDDPDDLAILNGILSMAAALDRQVIAEGVETVEQGTMLLQLGCEFAQGYGIARPMPADDFPEWVAAWRPDSAWSDASSVNRRDY